MVTNRAMSLFDHFNQLAPYAVGFDRIFNNLNRFADSNFSKSDGYPPYNIRKEGDYNFVIEMALAGFGKKDIEVEVVDSELSVRSVKENTDGTIDDVPPIGKSINTGYWYDYIDKVVSDKSIPIEYGSWNILGTEYPPSLPGNVEGSWIYKAAEIDNDTRNGSANDFTIKYGAKPGGFAGKLRLKLRQFRFLRAIQKANAKGELADFLVHMYYYAAKQNISEGDIHGPFLKIS